MKKFFIGGAFAFYLMSVTAAKAEEGEQRSLHVLGELRVCDPYGGGWGADYAVATAVQTRLLSMSSLQFVPAEIHADYSSGSLRGPAIFTVFYGEDGARAPTAEDLLSIVRFITTCGELRIPF